MADRYYYDSPVFGKMGPFNTSEEAQAASDREFSALKFIAQHEMAIVGSVAVFGLMAITLRHPKEMQGILSALTGLVGATVKGTGEIVKGVGEVIPG